MPNKDGTGPLGQGTKTGRKLGNCKKSDSDITEKLGEGQGKKRKSGGGTGKGKRLKTSEK